MSLNIQANSYTELQVKRQYITVSEETYISLRHQLLTNCKTICYEFYSDKLFAVKHKSKYSWKSAIYFNLGPYSIKGNCTFDYYFNNSKINSVVLGGGIEIILANWPNNNHILYNKK